MTTTATIGTTPSGKAAGTTTIAGTSGAAVGTTGGAGLGVLVAYLMVKSGLEQNPETAVLIGGVIAGLLATAAGTLLTFILAKRTPTNQTQTVVEFVGVDTPDPEVEAVREAAAAGTDPDYEAKHAATPVIHDA